jgi:hypothetical protein
MKVDQSFDANTYQQIVQHGLLLHMDLDPQPGNNQLRLGVQDNRTGLVGSLGALCRNSLKGPANWCGPQLGSLDVG